MDSRAMVKLLEKSVDFELRQKDEDIAKLQQWVDDLQSGMYINCVYCGHRYWPKEDVVATMSDILKAHIEVCPKHPLAWLREAVLAADYVFEGETIKNYEISEYIFEEYKSICGEQK